MRSYDTSRTVFAFMELLAWCGLVGGGFLFALGLSAIFGDSGFGNRVSGILMIPGAIFMVFGLLSIAIVQTGRAGVDTAELTGQILKVARDQLEVSRQSLRTSEAGVPSYEGLARAATDERPLADFGTALASGQKQGGEAPAKAGASKAGAVLAKVPAAGPDAPVEALPHGAIAFLDYTILPQAGNYWVGDQFFTSLDAAKRHVEIMREG